MNQHPRTIDPNSGAMPFNEFDDQWPACGSCGCGPCMCEENEPTASIDDYPGTSQADIDAANAEGASTMNTHYHVIAHIPGCLNDTDMFPFDTITEARHEARELAQTYFGEETYTEHISADEYHVKRTPKSHGGYIIAVEPCTEAECLTDDAQY